MATLTEISSVSRKIIKWGAVAIVVIMLIPVGVRIGKQIYLSLNPPPPPPPTVKYGRLPELYFPQTGEATPEYKLETIAGGLPGDLPSVAKVYVVNINKSRLLVLDRIRQKVRNLGFIREPVQLDEKTYQFTQPELFADIKVDIISGGFTYKYDWTTDKNIYVTFNVPTGNRAISESKAWLQNLGLLPDDLAGGSGKVMYMVATGSAMVPTDSIYEANFVRVDLYRADKDELRFVTTGGDTSPTTTIMSGATGNRRVVSANYQYSEVFNDSFATYPLKGVKQAWDELVANEAFVAKRTIPKVIIRRVYMAYYESSLPQDFLQPVYVFEGDGGFMAYVQAVRDDYLQ